MECGEPAAEAGAAASAAGEASLKSPLDKPLAELTEEDIAQLTREDCRRFLKTKGMRRPSWNKGQAIQQVISLKALIEGRPGCGDCPAGGGILRKPPLELESRPQFHDSPPGGPKDGGGGGSCSGQQAPTNEPSSYRRRDPIPPVAPPPSSAGNPACRTARSYPPRPPGSRFLFSRVTEEPPAAQMTVFYDGRVNVYDGVSVDQARAIMELAASPACFDDPPGPIIPPAPRRAPPVFRLPGAGPFVPAPPSARSFPIPAAGGAPHLVAEGMEERHWRVPRETEPEGPTSRRASLRRYLDKRKDRFKGKKILGEPTSSDMEMYLSHRLNCATPSEIPNLNDTSISALPEPPQSLPRCSSSTPEKVLFDLNDDGSGN